MTMLLNSKQGDEEVYTNNEDMNKLLSPASDNDASSPSLRMNDGDDLCNSSDKPQLYPGSFLNGLPRALAILVVFLGAFELGRRSISPESSQPKGVALVPAAKQRKEDVVYGHVHIAKTGGTTLAGYMALNYERVCTNKGYSVDFYHANEKAAARLNATGRNDVDMVWAQRNTTSGLGFEEMKDIGFEDCDYISLEKKWKGWEYFIDFPIPMQLHVPCRDPLDHLLSQCNRKGIDFNCSADDLQHEIKSCLVGFNRFSRELLDLENTNVKCYDFKQMTEYFDYMGQRLEHRRLHADYVFRSTNRPRRKEKECLLYDVPQQERVKSILSKYDYYDFCSACLGSENDLLH